MGWIFLRSGISFRTGGGVNWDSYWASLISATVENAAPTNVVLTFPTAQTSLVASDFTIAGFTINSASWAGAVLTLVLSTSVIYEDSLTITFVRTGGTAVITNNISAEAETIIQKDRIETDGGIVVDLTWINSVIRALKEQNIYSGCKLLTDANFGVKKDITGAVSKLYDISGNNNDAVQATGANQPIWTANQQNGKAGLVFDGVDDKLSLPNMDWSAQTFSICSVYKYISIISYGGVVSIGTDSETTGYGFYRYITTSIEYLAWGSGNGKVTNSITNGVFGIRFAVMGSNIHNGWINAVACAENPVSKTDSNIAANSPVSIGNLFNAYFSNSGICSVMLFPATALTTAQRQAMESLLNQYYSIY